MVKEGGRSEGGRKKVMYLDGGWSGGECDEGASCLIAYGRGGGVEEVVDAPNEPGTFSGVRMTHLWVDKDRSMTTPTLKV